MKTAIIVIAGILSAGIASAQTAVTTSSSNTTTIRDNSVNTGTTVNATARTEKINVSTGKTANVTSDNRTAVASNGQVAVSADKTLETADIAANNAAHTTAHVTAKTTAEVKNAGQSAVTGVKTTGKVVSSQSIKATTGVSSAIRTMPVRTSTRIGANIGVGLIK